MFAEPRNCCSICGIVQLHRCGFVACIDSALDCRGDRYQWIQHKGPREPMPDTVRLAKAARRWTKRGGTEPGLQNGKTSWKLESISRCVQVVWSYHQHLIAEVLRHHKIKGTTWMPFKWVGFCFSFLCVWCSERKPDAWNTQKKTTQWWTKRRAWGTQFLATPCRGFSTSKASCGKKQSCKNVWSFMAYVRATDCDWQRSTCPGVFLELAPNKLTSSGWKIARQFRQAGKVTGQHRKVQKNTRRPRMATRAPRSTKASGIS